MSGEEFLFYTLYNINPISRNRLNQLLFKFTYKLNEETVVKIKELINSKISDNLVITKLTEYIPKITSEFDSSRRGKKFADEWFSVIKTTKLNFTKYLDVGSNTGSITVEFGKNLGLNKDSIHGIDLDSFSTQKIIPVKGFDFQYYNGLKIPFNDNTFDIITCSMVLHHVKYQSILISDIRRVLKKNGIILIKEHDSKSESVDNLIKLEHLLYDTLSLGLSYNNFSENYYFRQTNKSILKNIMLENGFTQIKITDSFILEKYYKFNPTKHFYHIYKKTTE